MKLWRRLRWPVVAASIAVVGGTVGFRVLEQWSWLDAFWMVVITLTTVGFGEVHPLSPQARVFTILLIVGGVSIGTYTVTRVTQSLLEGDLIQELAERRQRRKLEKLSRHFVVVGYGRLGRELAMTLFRAGYPVVVIDKDAARLEGVLQGLAWILGDGSSDEVLERAGIHRASGIAIATESDATNVFITLAARQLAPDIPIVTRVAEDSSTQKAVRAGATGIFNPFGMSGSRMAHALIRPQTARFVDLATGHSDSEFALEDVVLSCEAQVREFETRHKVVLVAVRKADGRLVSASDPATTLGAGDVAVVVGHPRDLAALTAREVTDHPSRR